MLNCTDTPRWQYVWASASSSLAIITPSPVPSLLPTPMNSGPLGVPVRLMISWLMVLAKTGMPRKFWYLALSSFWMVRPG